MHRVRFVRFISLFHCMCNVWHSQHNLDHSEKIGWFKKVKRHVHAEYHTVFRDCVCGHVLVVHNTSFTSYCEQLSWWYVSDGMWKTAVDCSIKWNLRFTLYFRSSFNLYWEVVVIKSLFVLYRKWSICIQVCSGCSLQFSSVYAAHQWYSW